MQATVTVEYPQVPKGVIVRLEIEGTYGEEVATELCDLIGQVKAERLRRRFYYVVRFFKKLFGK